MKKIITIVLTIIILLIIIPKLLPVKRETANIIYDMENGSQTIELVIPKYSFLTKQDYQNKLNLRTTSIQSSKKINKLIQKELSSYTKINCNNTTYYYNNNLDFTIKKYQIKNYLIYTNIYYEYSFGNYCNKLNLTDSEIINLNTTYKLSNKNKEYNYNISLQTGYNSDSNTAKLEIYITDIKTKNIIFSDKSIGNIELIDNKTKLKYTKETYLTNNSELSKELFFIIDNKNTLYLDNDYLFKYINTDIILQSNSN